MLVENSHAVYIINHSILFLIIIHTVTYHTNTQSLHLSCLCLLFHITLRYLIVSFSIFFQFSHGILLLFHIPPYHLSNPLQPLSIFLLLLDIKCIQRMRTQWAQHFQRPRIYHNYSYYPYFYPDWAPCNPFRIGPRNS